MLESMPRPRLLSPTRRTPRLTLEDYSRLLPKPTPSPTSSSPTSPSAKRPRLLSRSVTSTLTELLPDVMEFTDQETVKSLPQVWLAESAKDPTSLDSDTPSVLIDAQPVSPTEDSIATNQRDTSPRDTAQWRNVTRLTSHVKDIPSTISFQCVWRTTPDRDQMDVSQPAQRCGLISEESAWDRPWKSKNKFSPGITAITNLF